MTSKWPDPASEPARQYLHYLHLLGQAPAGAPAPLDLLDERLLDFLGGDWHHRQATAQAPITVLEVLHLAPMSSSAAHRHLKALRRLSLIALQTDEADERVKRVLLTAQAHHYFAHKGRCLAQAAQPSGPASP